MRGKDLVEGLGEMLDKMEAVRDLGGGRRALARPVGVGARPIACDHRDAGMRPEPLCQGVSGALGQERHGLAPLQVDQDRAIRLALPQGKIVHTEGRWSGTRRQR
jgi:hypothetical protein